MALRATTLPDWVDGMLADDGWSCQQIWLRLNRAPHRGEPMDFHTNLLDFSYDPAEDTFTVAVSYLGDDDPDAEVTLSSADFLSELLKHTRGAP